ncbi:MAG: putative Ig domain-containing protein [Pseudomonadota bacterium]
MATHRLSTANSLVTIIIALALTACGGGGGGGAPVDPPASNTGPTIAGQPPTETEETVAFTFSPTANDADGDALTFSIDNAPPWAQFDTSNGTLSGTPSIDDQGTYASITIRVSDGEAEATLAPFTLQVIDTLVVTLEGVATDDPLAGATVTAAVGDRDFTTTTDASGAYALPLRAPAEGMAAMMPITLSARGSGTQAQVELIAHVASVAQLKVLAEAEDDGSVTLAQAPRLAVSHLSTARFLLTEDTLAEGADPNDFANIEAAEQSIPTNRLLEVAGLIKLINDEGLLPIAADQTSLSLLRSPADATERNATRLYRLLQENGLADGDGQLLGDLQARVDEAISSTLSDTSLSIEVTAEEWVGDSLWVSATRVGSVGARGEIYALAEDGTGRWYEDLDSLFAVLPEGDLEPLRQRRLSWRIQEGGDLRLEYPDADLEVSFSEDIGNVAEFGFPQEVVDFLAGEFDPPLPTRITFFARIDAETVEIGSRTANRLAVRRTRQFNYEIDDFLIELDFPGPLPRAPITVVETLQILLPGGASVEPFPAVAGDAWALPVIYTPSVPRLDTADPALAVDLIALGADGTTTEGLYGAASHSWQVNATGELELSLGDRTYRYRLVQRGRQFDLVLLSIFDAEQLAGRALVRAVRADEVRTWPTEQLVATQPAYWQDGLQLLGAQQYGFDGLLLAEQVDGYLLGPAAAGRFGIVGSAVPECFEFAFPCFTLDDGWLYGVAEGRLAFVDTTAFSVRENAWELVRYDDQAEVATIIEYGVTDLDGEGPVEFSDYPRLNSLERGDLSSFMEAYERTISLGGLDFEGG